jgi:hypothetical protein
MGSLAMSLINKRLTPATSANKIFTQNPENFINVQRFANVPGHTGFNAFINILFNNVVKFN